MNYRQLQQNSSGVLGDYLKRTSGASDKLSSLLDLQKQMDMNLGYFDALNKKKADAQGYAITATGNAMEPFVQRQRDYGEMMQDRLNETNYYSNQRYF